MINSLTKQGPYSHLNQKDSDQVVSLHCRISKQDFDFLYTVCPLQGVAQFVFSTVISNVCNSLRKNGITTYNPDAFIAHLRRLTDSDPSGGKPLTNDTGKTPSVCPTPAPTPFASCTVIGTQQGKSLFDENNFPVQITKRNS